MGVHGTCLMRKLRTTIFMTKTKCKKNKDLHEVKNYIKIFYLWRWKMATKITAPVFTFIYIVYTVLQCKKYKMFQGTMHRWFGFHTLLQKLHQSSNYKIWKWMDNINKFTYSIPLTSWSEALLLLLLVDVLPLSRLAGLEAKWKDQETVW